MRSQEEIAQELSKFLVERDRYSGKSPLDQLVEKRITVLAGEVADQVVAENPMLREVVHRRTRGVITAALRDDSYLRNIVAGAVAKALGQLVEEREREAEDSDA